MTDMSAAEFLRALTLHYNFEPLPESLEYTERCEASLRDKQVWVGVMDGGMGKTLGYLVPVMMRAAQTGLPVVIATSTIGNRNQAVADYDKIVEFSKTINHPLANIPMTNYRSRRDYASPQRIAVLLERLRSANASPRLIRVLQNIHERVRYALKHGGSTLIDDVMEFDLVDDQERMVIARRDIGHFLSDKASDELTEKTAALRENLSSPAVIFLTHPMLEQSYHLKKLISEEKIAAVVIDEADRVLSMDFITRATINLEEVSELLSAASQLGVSSSRAIKALADANNISHKIAHKGHHSFIMLTVNNIGEQLCTKMFDTLGNLQNELIEIGEKYNRLDHTLTNTEDELADRQFAFALDQIIGSLDRLTGSWRGEIGGIDTRRLSLSEFSVYLRQESTHVEIIGLAANPGRLLSDIFNSPVPIVLTTATLFSEVPVFAAEIGLSMNRIHPASTTIRARDYGNMNFVYFSNLSPPVVDGELSSQHWDEAARAITKVYESGKRMLVLTPGYRDIEMIYDRVREMAGQRNIMLLPHRRADSVTHLHDQFVESPGILFSVVWEGFNIVRTGNLPLEGAPDRRGLIDQIVISRLPFAPPNPILTHLMAHVYGPQARNWLFAHQKTDVVRRMAQGMMRGIRGPNDNVTVYFLDHRIPPPPELIQEYPLLRAIPKHGDLLRAIPPRFVHDVSKFSVLDL